MSDDLKASPASDFEQERKLVTLPRPGAGGRPLRVLIRAVPVPDLLAALDGIPGADVSPAADAPQPSYAEVRERLLKQSAPMQRIAELGVVEPALSFGERVEGRAHWSDLHFENQSAVMAEVLALSGMGGAREEAAPAASFPAVAGE